MSKKEEKNPVSGREEAIENDSQTQKTKSDDYFADFDFESLEPDIKTMFKNGVHFGHQKSRKNPKTEEYIFETRNGINIINLQRTLEKLKEAGEFMEKILSQGQEILLVGTKKQAKKMVKSLAVRCGLPHVTERWLGGTFTNFGIISSRTRYLREGAEKLKKGEFNQYTKFERMKIAEELESLEEKIGGIKNMTKLPGAIFVTNLNEDRLAVKEARAKNIPVIALVDTNVDPGEVDYPVPANEDAVSSLKIMLSYIGKFILKAKEKAVAAASKPKAEEVK